MNLRIGLSPLKRLRCKLQSFMHFKILVFRLLGFGNLDAEILTITELSQITGANAVNVKRAILFWVVHGVLKETSTDTFRVLEHAEEASHNQSTPPVSRPLSHFSSFRTNYSLPAVTASTQSNVQSAAEQAESEMQIYWYSVL